MSLDTVLQDCTVRAGPLVNIPKLLVELGYDPQPIFARTGFKKAELEDTDHRISYIKGSQLLTECVAVTGCQHFGLLLGQMAGPSYLGVVGFLARTASTVGQALESLVENLGLHDEGGTCALHVEKDYSRLNFHIHQPGVAAAAQIYDMSNVIMCEIMRALCGKQWNASQVLIIKKKPRDVTPYARYFRTSLLFDSDNGGVVFPSHNLQLKPPMADELLYQHLSQEVDVLHQMQRHEIVEMLPAVLQRGLLHKQCTASDIADAFGLHERTLHRRLKSAGTSFRYELGRARESQSKQMLKNSSLPICDIATSVGYADSSGFIRAFHRWTGTSPAAWRKNNS